MTASRKALYISMRNNDDIIKDISQLRSKSETIEVFNNKIPFIIDRVESKKNKVEKTMMSSFFRSTISSIQENFYLESSREQIRVGILHIYFF